MGGVNPYITAVDAPKPSEPFTVTFVIEETGERTEFLVMPSEIPYGRSGLGGSLMDIAEGAGIEIEHACGGVCACATCHVYVAEGGDSCQPANMDEEDMLDTARALTTESRLSCQCVPDGRKNLTVVIPAWNKNLVKEGH